MPGYVCPDCQVTVPCAHPGEADLLAGVHNDLVHNGRETALVGVAA